MVGLGNYLLLSMHEWKQQHAHRVPHVDRVHLEVGTFTCVEPDQLVVTWSDAVKGTWLDGSELVIESVPLVGRCLRCQATYSPDPTDGFRSPCCQHPMEEIVSGRELRIRSVAYALDSPAPCPTAVC
jgi:hydrogenase nickel incorporation protein HypA/HybF